MCVCVCVCVCVCACVCFWCRETERAGQEGLTEEQQHCRKSRQPAAQEEQRHGQNTVGSERCGPHFNPLSFAGVVLIGDSSKGRNSTTTRKFDQSLVRRPS